MTGVMRTAEPADSKCVVDATGRRLTLRSLTALDRLRLFKAAGPELSMNQSWLGMAALAISVTAIDNLPIPVPCSEAQIEGLIERLGDHGLDAVAEAFQDADDSVRLVANAGNLSGTPN